MLGVVTEVTVKLIPKPACAQVVMASFASVEAAGNAVTQVIAAGMIPAGLEMMDRRATHMVEPFVRAGYDMDAQAILLCESDGTPEEVAHEIARMEAVFRDAGATRCQVSASEAERLKFWAGRKNAFPAAGACRPITTAWTAPSRAVIWRACWAPSNRWKTTSACAAPTSSMRATATCTR